MTVHITAYDYRLYEEYKANLSRSREEATTFTDEEGTRIANLISVRCGGNPTNIKIWHMSMEFHDALVDRQAFLKGLEKQSTQLQLGL